MKNVLSRERFWSADSVGTDVLRYVVAAIVFTHGAYRWAEGSLPKLGEILSAVGFPAGFLLANLVNLAEVGGAVLLVIRVGTWPVCFILAFIYAVGIALFHRHLGFFVVGPGTGGWEYSALLITCLLVVAWANRDRPLR